MPKSAAEATPPTGNRFVEFDEFIDYQLNKASRSIQSTDVLFGVVGAALGLTVYLFVFILADHWLVTGGLGTSARLAFWLVGLAGLGYWVTTRLIKPLNSRVNVLFAARQIERTQPALKSSLLTLTDLKQSGRAPSGQIRGSLEKRAAVGLSKADVEEAVDRSSLMTSSYALLFLLATFCGYALFSPKSIVQSAWRAFVPFTQTGAATRTRIDHVNPGDTTVPALSHLDVEVEISGQAPEEATLYYTTSDGAFVNEAVPLRDSGEGLRRYRGTLIGSQGRGLQQNLSYHVVAGDARSQTYSVTVVQSPSAVVDSVGYEYQTYTGLANKDEPGGAIDAWEGTRVTVLATANQKVKSATILFSDTEDTAVKAEEAPMLVTEGTNLKASWQLAFRSGSDRSFPKFYRVQVKTEEGHEDPVPTLQPLNIRPDLPPKAEVLFPKNDIQAPVNAVVGIAYRAADPDFKLRSLVLNLEHDGQILASSPRLFDGPPDEESREGVYELRLKDLNLAAGSRLTYWLEARDNFETFGDHSANRTLSPRLNIDLVNPQPPAQAPNQEQAAGDQAQQALEQSRPDQGQPAGADDAGEKRPDQPQEPSDAAPSEEPTKGDGQQSDAGAPGEQKDTQDNKTEPSKSGQDAPPMPGDPSQDPQAKNPQQNQEQQAGTPPQNGAGNRTDEKQQGEQGTPQTDGQQPQSGQPQQGSKGQRGGQKETPGTKQNAQPGTEKPSRSGERAPDDTALKKLLEWSEKQKGAAEEKGGEKPGDSGTKSPEQSTGNEKQDGLKGDEPQSPDDRSAPGESGANESSAKNPSNPMKGQEDSPASQPATNDTTSQKDDQGKAEPMDQSKSGETSKSGEPGGKQAGEPMQDPSATSEKPSADNREGGKTGDRPDGQESKSTSPEKSAQPGTNDNASKTNPSGQAPRETATEATKPGQPGATPEPGQKQPDENSGVPGAPGDENAKSPMGDKGAPGEKAGSTEKKDQTPGATDANSKGQESPTGDSGDRKQSGDQNAKPQEKPGNSAQKPVGQKDDMGTREGGEGEPGSSTPSDSGGQKTPGQGDAGKNGEQSSSGEKSGAGKPGEGSQSAQPGSKPGGDSGGEKSSKPDQDGGKSGGQSGKQGGEDQDMTGGKQSADGKQPGGQQSGAGKKDGSASPDSKSGGEKSGGDKPQDGKSGGEEGGEQKQPGDQQGGKPLDGDQQSQDGGQQGKSDSEGSPGQGSSQGESSGTKPGSQAGSKPGMGGGSGSGPGSATAEGSAGKEQSGGSRPDPVDLENRKKATNLALQRLQETLERGEIDPELQKELNFTDEELQSFMDRLQERLADNVDDNSPEAQARRRQFESLLKGINLQTETGARAGSDGTGQAASGFGASKRPAPREYQAAEKKYRESLSGQKRGR